MRQQLVVGNWKMHGTSAGIRSLLEGLSPNSWPFEVDTVVCPPFPYLQLAGGILKESGIALGAQNVAEFDRGAFTGEVAAGMLADVGCRFVIVGHSERRARYGESNAVVAAKVSQVLEHGMTPIVCVGETLAERQREETLAVVGEQLRAVMRQVGESQLSRLVLAYEPVWAIGTGETATPEQAQAVHSFLRGSMGSAGGSVRILYGGSVKAANAAGIFGQPDIDGGLIGGASLDAQEFCGIVKAAG